MGDPGGNEPVPFSDATADALIAAFTNAASDVEGQSGSRSSLVATASREFRGLFSELFAANAVTAARGARDLVARLREVADFAGELRRPATSSRPRSTSRSPAAAAR